jgi:hypothetical protein
MLIVMETSHKMKINGFRMIIDSTRNASPTGLHFDNRSRDLRSADSILQVSFVLILLMILWL